MLHPKFEQITVSVDGTSVSYQRAGEMIEQLELQVAELLAKVEQADATPLQDLTVKTAAA